jgi:hypothetical protein
LRRVFPQKKARPLKCCAHPERFPTHAAGPFPSTALTELSTTFRSVPLDPSRGEAFRPNGFSHRRRDAKSLVCFQRSGDWYQQVRSDSSHRAGYFVLDLGL